MAAPQITALPTPPSRADAPDVFSQRADAFLGALPLFRTESNEQADYLEGRAVNSANSATASANSAAVALAREQAATTQAQLAQGFAEDSANSAGESAAFAAAAGTAANIGPITMTASRISTDLTIPTNFNALSVGPMVIDDGARVVINDFSRWSIV